MALDFFANPDRLLHSLDSKIKPFQILILICIYRNRVAVQLQKNLDRVRLRRIQQKLSNSGGPPPQISSHPSGQLITKEGTPATEDEDDCSGAR